jgi:hypothetical protein
MMTEPGDPQPAAEKLPEQTPPGPEAAQETARTEAEKPKTKRERPLLRKILLWCAGCVVLFLAGMLTLYFVRYQPLNQTLIQVQKELTVANQAKNDLEKALAAADDKLTTLTGDNETLQSELDITTTRLDLLQMLVAVDNARLALTQNDVEGAKAALKEAPNQLEGLLPSIAGYDAGMAESMPQRLALIIGELDRDVETARIDLELFTNDLLEINTALAGGG